MDVPPVVRRAHSPEAEPLSRLAAMTGWPDGPPLPPPGGVVQELDALVAAIARWSAAVGVPVHLDWGTVVCGRAALLGLARQGRRSANGSCRLLRTAEGWVAVNLPRPEDLDAVGALVGRPCDDEWGALEEAAAATTAVALATRARLLGMPAAVLPAATPPAPPIALGGHAGWYRAGDAVRTGWPAPGGPDGWRARPMWSPAPPRPLAGVRVVDLSAMWAGPLATAILAAAGATVFKVETASRPDAARQAPAFYRWLHPADQPGVTLDLAAGPAEHRRLRALIEEADIVVESSRPRAFEQMGIGPAQVASRAGRVWLSITGYGREAPGRDWVAFGDDAAVAGGLVARDPDGEPVFCGDAMADPVTGLVGALAVLRAMADGGGVLLDVAMSRCAASLVARSGVVTAGAGR